MHSAPAPSRRRRSAVIAAVVVVLVAVSLVIVVTTQTGDSSANGADGTANTSSSASSTPATQPTSSGDSTSSAPARGSSPSSTRHLIDATDVSGDNVPARYKPRSVTSLQRAEPDLSITIHQLDVGRFRRAYVVVAPAKASRSSGRLPTIVYLHGVNAAVATEIARDGLLSLPRAGRAVLVYPVGYEASWNIGADGCCGAAAKANTDDVTFVERVVADARRTAPVDPQRTYLIGLSNGGKLVYDLLCTSATPFAAVAVFSAVPIKGCPQSRPAPVPFWLGIGTADHDLPNEGDAKPPLPLQRATLAQMRSRDTCSGEPTTGTVAAAAPRPTVTLTKYACAGGRAVWGATFADTGHLATITGGLLSWDFLSRFSRS